MENLNHYHISLYRKPPLITSAYKPPPLPPKKVVSPPLACIEMNSIFYDVLMLKKAG